MNSLNKKNTRQINKSVSNSNVEVFLAYCAYDVRWNLTGNPPPPGIQNLTHISSKPAKGETPSQNASNPIAGEGKTMKSN